jgi:putative methyltransferase (TIGR04325 family)
MTINQNSKVWEGVYETFAQAGGHPGVHEEPVWLGKVIERARQAVQLSGGPSALAPIAVTRDYALPFVAALIARREKPLRILDFGGGLGASFLPLLRMLPPDQPIDFVVVENHSVCAAGREFFKDFRQITFREEVPDSNDGYDIIHCGSSFHYVDDWQGMLKRLTTISADYLIFVDLPAADNKAFVTIQHYYGYGIPVHFWNLKEFISMVESHGYGLVFQARYKGSYLAADEDLPTLNFDSEHRLNYISQLIFRRNAELHTER